MKRLLIVLPLLLFACGGGGSQVKAPVPITPAVIAADGDSITAGFTVSPWPEDLKLGKGSIVNHATSGSVTADMLTRWEAYKNDGSNWVIILGGMKDVLLDVPVTTIEANLTQIWTEAQAKGVTVVAMTTTPLKGNIYDLWTPERQIAQDSLNAWIRSYAAAHNLILVDTWKLMLDPANADTLNPAYDSGDHVHPSVGGNQVIANGIQAVLPPVN